MAYAVIHVECSDCLKGYFQELEQAITPKTCLVSVMLVNNEIGVIQPIKEIGKLFFPPYETYLVVLGCLYAIPSRVLGSLGLSQM